METDEGALELVKNTALYLILNKLSAKLMLISYSKSWASNNLGLEFRKLARN